MTATEDRDGRSAKNTDRLLWQQDPDEVFSDSIHVTEGGGIGINCGGLVIVKPLRTWHALASPSTAEDRDSPREEKLRELARTVVGRTWQFGSGITLGETAERFIEPLLRAHEDAVRAARDMEWWEAVVLADNVAPTPEGAKHFVVIMNDYCYQQGREDATAAAEEQTLRWQCEVRDCEKAVAEHARARIEAEKKLKEALKLLGREIQDVSDERDKAEEERDALAARELRQAEANSALLAEVAQLRGKLKGDLNEMRIERDAARRSWGHYQNRAKVLEAEVASLKAERDRLYEGGLGLTADLQAAQRRVEELARHLRTTLCMMSGTSAEDEPHYAEALAALRPQEEKP